jgi:hypothetical protein
VRLLFELALLRFDPHEFNTISDDSEAGLDARRCQELQMQMLYVIGRVAERVAPAAYFNFDGVGASLKLKTLERFPSPKNGYSVCCWFKVNSFFDAESTLLCWQNGNKAVFELFFLQTPRPYDAQVRSLCVRTDISDSTSSPVMGNDSALISPGSRRGRTFLFDKFAFEQNGQWHHLVLVHSARDLSLFVDGQLIQRFVLPASEYANTAHPNMSVVTPSSNSFCFGYPTNVSRSEPLTGSIGQPVGTSSRMTSFCGQIGAIGIWEVCFMFVSSLFCCFLLCCPSTFHIYLCNPCVVGFVGLMGLSNDFS